jgi:hypothetical protein
MTRVLIVSRTLMYQAHCIGGLTRDDLAPVRLCPSDLVHGLPPDAPYQIGEVWDLDLAPPTRTQPPHVEDVILRSGRRIAVQTGMRRYLWDRVRPWRGGPEALFDGAMRFTATGRGHLTDGSATAHSVGFWQTAGDLVLQEGRSYRYASDRQQRTMKYVGVQEPDERIPAGSLVRVSLSRSFTPVGGPTAFWLQVSGWYPD